MMVTDVERVLTREPKAIGALLDQAKQATGANRHLDQAVSQLDDLAGGRTQIDGRRLLNQIALVIPVCQPWVRHPPP